MWEVRSFSGNRNIMRYIVAFIIRCLWLKLSVQYEIKNLPWVVCVCVCVCPFRYNGTHCNSLRVMEWSQPSKWPIDNLGQQKGCPVVQSQIVLSVHGMRRENSGFQRGSGGKQLLSDKHKVPHYLAVTLISLTCIHADIVLIHAGRKHDKRTLFHQIISGQNRSLYRG